MRVPPRIHTLHSSQAPEAVQSPQTALQHIVATRHALPRSPIGAHPLARVCTPKAALAQCKPAAVLASPTRHGVPTAPPHQDLGRGAAGAEGWGELCGCGVRDVGVTGLRKLRTPTPFPLRARRHCKELDGERLDAVLQHVGGAKRLKLGDTGVGPALLLPRLLPALPGAGRLTDLQLAGCGLTAVRAALRCTMPCLCTVPPRFRRCLPSCSACPR